MNVVIFLRVAMFCFTILHVGMKQELDGDGVGGTTEKFS